MLRMGAATMVLLIAIFHQTFRVNLGAAERIEGAWLVVAAYVAYAVIWTISLIRRFRRPPTDPLAG